MPGILQPPAAELGVAAALEVPTEEEAIALAIAMCPPGEVIELHDAGCPMRPCRCDVKVMTAPARGLA